MQMTPFSIATSILSILSAQIHGVPSANHDRQNALEPSAQEIEKGTL